MRKEIIKAEIKEYLQNNRRATNREIIRDLKIRESTFYYSYKKFADSVRLELAKG